jgi:hypothetical protein
MIKDCCKYILLKLCCFSKTDVNVEETEVLLNSIVNKDIIQINEMYDIVTDKDL